MIALWIKVKCNCLVISLEQLPQLCACWAPAHPQVLHNVPSSGQSSFHPVPASFPLQHLLLLKTSLWQSVCKEAPESMAHVWILALSLIYFVTLGNLFDFSISLSQSICAATAKYHSLGGLSNKHLFFTVLEAGSSTSECQHGQVLVRTLSRGADCPLGLPCGLLL